MTRKFFVGGNWKCVSVPQCKTFSFFSFLLEHPSSSSSSSSPTCAGLFFLDFLAAAFAADCFCNLHGAKPSVTISESSTPPPRSLSLSLSLSLSPSMCVCLSLSCLSIECLEI